MLECQYGYILQALQALRERRADALDLRRDAMEQYNRHLQREFEGTAWAGSCSSWYKTSDGRITNNWSGSVEEYKRRTALFDPSDYEVIRPPRADRMSGATPRRG